jgi:hypothetical protein
MAVRNTNTAAPKPPAKKNDEVMRVQIFDWIYDYNSLSEDSKKMFILQDDIRRDLAFQHARADASLLYIREQLTKLVKNETPLGPVNKDKG